MKLFKKYSNRTKRITTCVTDDNYWTTGHISKAFISYSVISNSVVTLLRLIGGVFIETVVKEILVSNRLLLAFWTSIHQVRVLFRGRYFCCIMYKVYLYLLVFNFDLKRLINFNQFLYCVFICCFVTPLSLVRRRVERSQTGLTPPHTKSACSKPGTCSPVVCVV